jgi:hypothetical protein
MQDRGLGDLVADAEHRVQARHRLLEDHREVAAAELPQRGRRQLRQIDHRPGAGAEQDLAAGDAPGGSAIRPMIERLVTDLPEPDSPTTASVSPASSVKETSSTALTSPPRWRTACAGG